MIEPSARIRPGNPAEARTTSQRARRARIIDAAIPLLTEREFDQIQIREVADGADVALTTVYRYFPSKELLFAPHSDHLPTGRTAQQMVAREADTRGCSAQHR
ncbi:TetR/AcrR family transcriptional regulator [Nocardia aurantia]|uniref:TetR/AcrR family transcriptional regulator n=1 Tax=Nocardia aurantia TaxID=2585199 RepID=UPI0012967F8E|nr:helix-turn-helix domain-containing protein [Nocardia aurantia]